MASVRDARGARKESAIGEPSQELNSQPCDPLSEGEMRAESHRTSHPHDPSSEEGERGGGDNTSHPRDPSCEVGERGAGDNTSHTSDPSSEEGERGGGTNTSHTRDPSCAVGVRGGNNSTSHTHDPSCEVGERGVDIPAAAGDRRAQCSAVTNGIIATQATPARAHGDVFSGFLQRRSRPRIPRWPVSPGYNYEYRARSKRVRKLRHGAPSLPAREDGQRKPWRER